MPKIGCNSVKTNNLKILVCCHKPCELPEGEIYLPIQVGAALSDFVLGMQRDNLLNGRPCDNISSKNKSYCELTALYWAWKNIKNIYPNLEYIGLCHYRRFFNIYKFQKIKPNEVFVSRKYHFPYSVEIAYKAAHISDDFNTLRFVVHDLYPSYDTFFNKYMSKSNSTYLFNMFLGGYGFFNDYCTWLFDILFEVEKRIDISKYSDVQKRVFGYMAERLLGVFLSKNKKKYKAISKSIIFTDSKKHIFSKIHSIVNTIRYDIAFLFGRGSGRYKF